MLAIAEELNYRPNALARSLILGRSEAVGVIVTKYTLRYNPDVLFALGEALAAANSKLLLITVESDQAVHDTLGRALDFPLDGLISCADLSAADIKAFQQHDVPVVLFNRHSTARRVDSVATDNANASKRIAAALRKAGHSRFLCIGGPEDAPVSRARIDAFVEEVQRLGARWVNAVHTDFSYEDGSSAMSAAYRRSNGEIDAVFCANDQTALGALDACRFNLGLSVPENISIVGFDDVPDASRPTYMLTTVRQDVQQLSREAVRLLALRLADPSRRAGRVIVPSTLIERASAKLWAGSS
ncbi:Transcriptional regulator, LacI family [Caballeronia sordidicola]|uniref:Transcriptional regulator, LacI family n=1 Tax=Caballeronia sordidicola TaxID=196367 RepID=A0A242N443_CABSO|nr:Transcriptional regulator, LacI family [Caballeronia sordidicola]